MTRAALREDPFVYVHLKGPDEPGHDGQAVKKKEIIEDLDRSFFGPFLEGLDWATHRILVTADHSTPCVLRSHSDDPVPLLLVGAGIPADGPATTGTPDKFCERRAAAGSLGTRKGREVLPAALGDLADQLGCAASRSRSLRTRPRPFAGRSDPRGFCGATSRSPMGRPGSALPWRAPRERPIPGSIVDEREFEELPSSPRSYRDLLSCSPELLAELPRAFDVVGDVGTDPAPEGSGGTCLRDRGGPSAVRFPGLDWWAGTKGCMGWNAAARSCRSRGGGISGRCTRRTGSGSRSTSPPRISRRGSLGSMPGSRPASEPGTGSRTSAVGSGRSR